MKVSRAHRAAVQRSQATRLHMSVVKLPTAVSQSFINASPTSGVTARNLWWWSHRHDCSMDEDMEQRFVRHQKLMRNRYSKFLRRRSIWEEDEHTKSPVWARSRRWLVTRWTDKKALSYKRALQAAMQEQGKHSDHERPWKEWDGDFEKLKTRIDDQINRDRYSTLSGQHLRGPPSPNNSSWTSFSWIYGPLRSMQQDISSMSPDGLLDHSPSTVPASKPEGRTTFSVPTRAPGNSLSIRTSSVEQEYEFDPISMRKIPKQKEVSPDPVQQFRTPSNPPPLQKPLLERLFSEHSVDVPVKTYKPHKVYGHGGLKSVKAKSIKIIPASMPKTSGINLESSRLRDLQALKFRTLGNSIDTTAEYGGKYKNPADPEPIHITAARSEPNAPKAEEVLKNHDVKDISGEDTGALFAGTTYEAKAKEIARISAPKPSFKTSWLEQEGFQTLPQTLKNSDTSTVKVVASLEANTSPQLSKIEPAPDRVKAYDVKLRSKQEPAMRRKPFSLDDKTEDVESLRASDTRSAVRSDRTTGQATEHGKEQIRTRSSTDYSKHKLNGAAKFAVNAESAKETVSRKLSNVWEHVKQYPQGIVAKTINGMGIFNDNYKTYVRLDKPAQDPTEKLIFKDEFPSKTPLIYRKTVKKSDKPLQTFTPSQEVVDVERAEKARLAFVRQVNEESKKKASKECAQAEALGSEIRKAYEEQYGKIDLDHRQAAASLDESQMAMSVALTAVMEFQKPSAALQPMGPATVKPGIKEDPVIQDHVAVFEPKFAKLVDEAKLARKTIHEAKLEVMAIRFRRPQTVWSDRSTETVSFSVPKPVVTRLEPVLDRSIKKQTLDATNEPARSVPSSKYTSEYIILAYDLSSNHVIASPLESSMPAAQESIKKTSVPQILSALNHTAKFLSHFTSLSNQGYEVVSGGGDILLFKKRVVRVAEPIQSPLLTHVKAIIEKNKLTARETSAQPVKMSSLVKITANPARQPMASAEPAAPPPKEAATVLDEIPALEPTPGPAGPTAPPMGPPSVMRPKVKRQENVFSASKTSKVSPPSSAAKTKESWEKSAGETSQEAKGLWSRFKRALKRVTMTAVAMGVGAYSIGAVAESLGAQQHPEKVIRSGRPGIYSTEDSR